MPKFNTTIFVNGCFWHGNSDKIGRTYPKNNAPFWENKLDKNKKRDKRNIADLKKLGWKVLVM